MRRQDLLGLPSTGSERWFDRRIANQLVAAGLVRSEASGKDVRFVATDPSFAHACAALIAVRPDIRLGWRTSLELRVLLTLPPWDGPPEPWRVAGCGERSWWRVLASLQDGGLVVRPAPGARRHTPNRLPELQRFLSEYHRQLAQPPRDLPGRDPTDRCIHQRGPEAAWRLGAAAPTTVPYAEVGPRAIPALAHLHDPFTVAYAGARTLDLWDHALLYALAHRRPHPERGVFEPRAIHLLAYLAGRHLPQRPGFRARAAFYGIPSLPDALDDAWRKHQDVVEGFGKTGAEEAFLDLRY